MLSQDISQVRNDFYDGLFLRSLLQSEAKRRVRCGEHDLPRIVTPLKRKAWQKFLDHMCLLCDSHPGGATTTAIAVEQLPERTIFWVACNSDANRMPQSHLLELLSMPRMSVWQLGTEEHYAIQIASKSVGRSL